MIEAEVSIWNAMRHLCGMRFDFAPELDWLREEFMFSRAAPIYGGSLEIQRTLVAQRLLGIEVGGEVAGLARGQRRDSSAPVDRDQRCQDHRRDQAARNHDR